jgi:hypothetical protein
LQVVPQTFDLIQQAAERITEVYADDFKTELAVSRAKNDAESFADEDFLDLQHLMVCLRDEYDGRLDIADLADVLVEHLEPGRGPIVANFHGHARKNANGLSVYFPTKRYSPFYDKQDFALSGWGHVIRRANRVEAPKIETAGMAFDAKTLVTPVVRWLVCPICGGMTEVPMNVGEVGETVGTKDVRDLLSQIIASIQEVLASPTADASNWLDLPCPHCEHTFQYNVSTGETRR